MGKYIFDGISVQNERSSNMDSLILKERTIENHQIYLAAVCDGVGSLQSGSIASSLLVRSLGEWFDSVTSTWRLPLLLRDNILEINRSIFQKAQGKGVQTASTLSALLIYGTKYHVVHAGDSRIYIYASNHLEQLTPDQVSQNGKLNVYIGSRREPALYYSEGTLSDEMFLLCSDGLYRHLEIQYLLAQMGKITSRNMHSIMKKIVKKAIRQGERDNITLAVIKPER